MNDSKSYIELDGWKKSRELATFSYNLTSKYPKEEVFGITNQIKRCSVSICSNIAEGVGRSSDNDVLRFLYISRGSLYELESQFYISFDLNFINEKELQDVIARITECKRLLSGFIKYYKAKI